MRIAFQCPVVQAETLAEACAGFYPSSGWTLESPLHVTILHLGRMEELCSEIDERLGSLGTDISSAVREFANTAANSCPDQRISLRANAFRVWAGPEKSFAVLLFEPPESLLGLRSDLESRFRSFLRELGVREAQAFLEGSGAIGFRRDWTPHVTLAFRQTTVMDLRAFSKSLEPPVEFEIGRVQPSSYGAV